MGMPVMDVRRMIVRVGQRDMQMRVGVGACAREQPVGLGVIVVLIVVTVRMRVLEHIVLVRVAVLLAE